MLTVFKAATARDEFPLTSSVDFDERFLLIKSPDGIVLGHYPWSRIVGYWNSPDSERPDYSVKVERVLRISLSASIDIDLNDGSFDIDGRWLIPKGKDGSEVARFKRSSVIFKYEDESLGAGLARRFWQRRTRTNGGGEEAGVEES